LIIIATLLYLTNHENQEHLNAYFKKYTFPIKADKPPRRAMPTATLAGAPPGAFLNAGASANGSPLTVGTKSISISPKQTTRGDSLASGIPSPGNAFPT
jgi:hypothetical protein